MSLILAIAGRPKAGKSSKAKEIAVRTLFPDADKLPFMTVPDMDRFYRSVREQGYLSRLMVYDVNKEWGFSAPLPTMDVFMTQATQAQGRMIVFEEATLFFDPTRGRSDKLREMLVRRRHTGIVVILLFHAIADIPLYVLRMLDVLVLFKTQDSFDDLRRIRHLRPVLDIFAAVNESPNLHAYGEYDFVKRTSKLSTEVS